jgi:hypothetical protein
MPQDTTPPPGLGLTSTKVQLYIILQDLQDTICVHLWLLLWMAVFISKFFAQ